MTAPDDLVQGLVKYLMGFPEVLATVGVFPTSTTPYLFQHSLWQRIEGTGSTAAVISYSGGWAGANEYNTMKFPRLSLEIYADPIRDAGRNITKPGEVYRRAYAAWEVFDRHLHRPASAQQQWGTIRTLGCLRMGEPNVYPVPDGDGSLRLQCFYGVAQG